MRTIRVVPVLLALLVVAVAHAQREPIGERPRADEGDYRVGIEDRLEIVVWNEPQLTRTVRVRPDGKISLPLVNDIAVAGQTTDQIRRNIAQKLQAFIREPNVAVIVEEIASFKVYFLGEVQSQTVQTFLRPTRLLQAVATSGGPTEFAKNDITIIREVDGLERRIAIKYKALLAGDPAQENIYLQPGDVVVFH